MKNQMKIISFMRVVALFSVMMLFSCEKEGFSPLEKDQLLKGDPIFSIAESFDVQDACYYNRVPYHLLIEISGEEVVLKNFLDHDFDLLAIHENGKFKIPPQTFTDPQQVKTMTIDGEFFINRTGGLEMVYQLSTKYAITECIVNGVPASSTQFLSWGKR